MANDELKKKILTIVRGAILEADELPFVETTEYVADALIAARIGDVKEAEHRAARAEKALRDMCEEYEDYFECNLYKECNSDKPCYLCNYTERLQQAEKELAEERKDD